MKKLLFSLAATVVVAAVFFSYKSYAARSFDQMCDEIERMPGEVDNCVDGGSRCNYTYDHGDGHFSNYAILESSNKN